MNRRIAKKILKVGIQRYAGGQCWQAILRLCGYTILPPTPDGWTLACWMRQHGVEPDQITNYDDLPDGSSAVRSWGKPDLSDCRHPADNGWCNPHLLSAAKIPPQRLAEDHELRSMVMAGIIGP